jgi:PST family polysaccharide transporter
VTTLLAPAFAVLVVCGDDAVSVVLGDRWAAAAAPLRVLAAVGILQTAISFCSVVLPVLDRTAELLRFAVLTATLSIAGFAAGLPWGTTGVAVGYLAANVVLVPLYLRLTARVLDVGGRAVATALAGPAALTGLVGTAALAGRLAAGAGDAPPAAALAAGAGLGLLAWALGVRALTPVLLAEGRRLWAARSAPVAA